MDIIDSETGFRVRLIRQLMDCPFSYDALEEQVSAPGERYNRTYWVVNLNSGYKDGPYDTLESAYWKYVGKV